MCVCSFLFYLSLFSLASLWIRQIAMTVSPFLCSNPHGYWLSLCPIKHKPTLMMYTFRPINTKGLLK